MSIELDDIISLDEAGEIAGRAPSSLRRAAALGKLEARRVGTPGRAYWVTTRAAVAAYLAYVASVSWTQQPQRKARRIPPRPRKRQPTRAERRH